MDFRRSSSTSNLGLGGGSPNPLDYGSSSLLAGAHRPGPVLVTSVVLDSHIPHPDDPDPNPEDEGGSMTPASAPATTTRIYTTLPSARPLAGHLPIHSRVPPRSPAKIHIHHTRTSSNAGSLPQLSGSGRASPVPAPDSMVRSSSGASDHAISGSPSASPFLKGLGTPVSPAPLLLYPSAMGDPLLANPTGGTEGSGFVHFFRGLFILLFCFMTPRHYDSLQRAKAARTATSPYSTYSKNTAARRHHARDRHRSRQSAIFAQHYGTAGGTTAPKPSRSFSDAGAGLSSGSLGSLPPLPPPSLSRDSDDSASDNDEEERSTTDRRTGPFCERPCFPRCCQSRCSKWYTSCCTVRRSACLTVYFVLIAVGVLCLLYWRWTLRDHGWQWPPRTS